MRSFPDAAKDSPSGIFVSQDSNDDNIGTDTTDFDKITENTEEVEASDTVKADNMSLSEEAEDCAEDEWSCHLKGCYLL